MYDPSFGGGIVYVAPTQSPAEKSLEEEKKMCVINNCEMKSGDNNCNEECNRYACNFDGGDCSLGRFLTIESYLHKTSTASLEFLIQILCFRILSQYLF